MKNKTWWHKRIPTSAALAVLLLSIWVTSYLLQKGTIFVGRAAPDKIPREVFISNVTDSSFTVAFTTLDKTQGAVKLEGNNEKIAFDDRNKNDPNSSFYSHSITVKELSPNTSYQFFILSDGETFKNGDVDYSVKTGPKITSTPPNLTPISGKVVLPDGTPAQDTLVQIKIPNAQIASQLTGNDGGYKIKTSSLRTADLKSYINIAPTAEITLHFSRQNLDSDIKSIFSNSSNLPQAVLSYAYDFTGINQTQEETLPSKLNGGVSSLEGPEIRIVNPKSGTSFIDTRPLFQGVALPGKKVNITIESNPIRATVIADSSGLWSFRPPTSLAPGNHKLTIQTTDSFGIVKILTVNFTVFAQGTQIANAQPSPTKTPTPTLVPTKAPTLTPAPLPSATIAPTSQTTPTPIITIAPTIQPTSAPTGVPTLTPAPTLIAFATTAPKPTGPTTTNALLSTPAPSGSSQAIFITFSSIFLVAVGGVLLFLL